MSKKTEVTALAPMPESALTPAPKRNVKFSGLTSSDVSLPPLEALEKSISNSIQAIQRGATIHSIGFHEDPIKANHFGQWKRKSSWQIPDQVIKRITMSDDLVAAIVQARSFFLSPFGFELQDRFSLGFRIEPNQNATQDWTPEQKEQLQDRIAKVSRVFATCGHTDGVPHDERLNLSSWMYQQVANGISYGRWADEIVYATGPDGRKRFHMFRPHDASTIYAAIPSEDKQGVEVRRRALGLLEKVNGEKLTEEYKTPDEYAWYQVIDDRAVQAFTAHEMYVHSIYPSTAVELMGYPLTPLDSCIAAVTTHMNITTHNKLYFQNGRGSRGMVVFQSEDIDQSVLDATRQHFQATATGVANSFRTPVLAVGANDKVNWVPLDQQGGRDMEFQYLSDSNARVILSAFMMSPEELAGYGYLSKGTNSQALSEGSGEWKLLAGRDTGLRPLLGHFQVYLNERIFPLIDPDLAKICTLKFYGLDTDSAEKESTRLQEDMPLHGTYDEMLERVEKDPIGKEWGGEFPFNAQYQQILYQNFTVGQIKAHFFGDTKAAEDPQWAYVRDPMWFQWQQMQMQLQQMQVQQQQMQAQAQAQAQPQQGGQPQGQPDQQQEQRPTEDSAAGDAQQIEQSLSKAEAHLTPEQRVVLYKHKKTVDKVMSNWKVEARHALRKITQEIKKI